MWRRRKAHLLFLLQFETMKKTIKSRGESVATASPISNSGGSKRKSVDKYKGLPVHVAVTPKVESHSSL
jgi:hypothetical protein